MKIFYSSVLLAVLSFCLVVPAQAEQTLTKNAGKVSSPISPWSLSYQLEARLKYAEAAAAIASFRTHGTDQELASLRTAWLEYLQGKYRVAVHDYQTAIQANPNAIDGHLGISLPLMAQQRWREARDHLYRVLKFSSWHYTAHLRLLTIEESLREWGKMESHAKALSMRYPTDTSAFVYLARAYAWQMKKNLAKEVYTQVLARSPTHLEAIAYLKNNP